MLSFPHFIFTEHVLFTSLLLLIQWLGWRGRVFMSCCIVQEQKCSEPRSTMKRSFIQSQYKTVLPRNKWDHSSFPLMKRKRIYDMLWNNTMYYVQNYFSLNWFLRTAVAVVKPCKDSVHHLPSITYFLHLNEPKREARPKQRNSKSCPYWFHDIWYHY